MAGTRDLETIVHRVSFAVFCSYMFSTQKRQMVTLRKKELHKPVRNPENEILQKSKAL